ncbi:hypothetical protein [Pseudonocardia parietis]|uniref:Uncharacterized protein n=1 Tax=Pseudonocardia parietis TaxID=570936 RepID=A0ABS4VWG0_9PSEU|nr:hypothetical protein [Pseudonocardia parietis]MBP2368256.1 hypothetical protein [Pseudonocardia parietis]
MSGRHRAPRVRRTPLRHTVIAALPAVVAVAAVLTVVAVVVGSGLLTAGAPAPLPAGAPAADATALAAPAARTAPLLRLPAPDAAPSAAADAARAAGELADRARSAQSVSPGVCDLDGPPRFDDPERPNVITNRDCGYVDEQGRERSRNPWIDGQLLAAQGG